MNTTTTKGAWFAAPAVPTDEWTADERAAAERWVGVRRSLDADEQRVLAAVSAALQLTPPAGVRDPLEERDQEDAAALATLPEELRKLAQAGIFRAGSLAAALADVLNGDGPAGVAESIEEGDLRMATLVAAALPQPMRDEVLVALAGVERSMRAAAVAAGGEPRQAPSWATRVLAQLTGKAAAAGDGERVALRWLADKLEDVITGGGYLAEDIALAVAAARRMTTYEDAGHGEVWLARLRRGAGGAR